MYIVAKQTNSKRPNSGLKQYLAGQHDQMLQYFYIYLNDVPTDSKSELQPISSGHALSKASIVSFKVHLLE